MCCEWFRKNPVEPMCSICEEPGCPGMAEEGLFIPAIPEAPLVPGILAAPPLIPGIPVAGGGAAPPPGGMPISPMQHIPIALAGAAAAGAGAVLPIFISSSAHRGAVTVKTASSEHQTVPFLITFHAFHLLLISYFENVCCEARATDRVCRYRPSSHGRLNSCLIQLTPSI